MKKGFTLIELLAVILILGIIALIAIPTVTNMIEESKRGALRTTALTLVKQAEQACTSEMIKGLEPTLFYTINDGKASGELNTKNLPKSGEIELDNNCKSKVAVSDGKYCVITDGDNINFKDDVSNCVLNEIVYTAEKCFIVSNNKLEGYNYDDEDCNTNNIVVPAIINGQKIKEISEYGFAIPDSCECYGYGVPLTMESIDLSNMQYLETIGENVFMLEYDYRVFYNRVPNYIVKLPKNGNLKTIGRQSFNQYQYNIDIPEGVITIDRYAFSNSNITEITIPSTVTTFGTKVFYMSSSLRKVINKTGKAFDWKDILGVSSCSSEGEFITGTCTRSDSTIIEIVGG